MPNTLNVSLTSPVDTTLNLFPSSSTDNSTYYRNKKKKQKHNSPMFISPAAQNRFSKNKLQPGSLITLGRESEILAKFLHAKWDFLPSFPTRKVCTNLVAEFYCNMGAGNGVNGVKYLTSVINGTLVLIDHMVLGKALRIHSNAVCHEPVDIHKSFVFKSEEQKLFLTVFCGFDVPSTFYENTSGINYEHFTPTYQILTQIVKSNVFPSQNTSKKVSFVEIKIMYKLLSEKIDFNAAYMILTKMFYATKMGYMPYGLLLTRIFDFFKFDTSIPPYFHVSHQISDRHSRTVTPIPDVIVVADDVSVTLPVVVPLSDSVNIVVGIPDSAELVVGPILNGTPLDASASTPASDHASLCTHFGILVKLSTKCDAREKEFQSLKSEFGSLTEKHAQLLERMDIVMTVLGSVMGRVNVLEGNLSQLVQFQINMNSYPPHHAPNVVIEAIESENVGGNAAGNGDGSGNSMAIDGAPKSDAMILAVINSDGFN